jgi:hypothetical protein
MNGNGMKGDKEDICRDRPHLEVERVSPRKRKINDETSQAMMNDEWCC